jgi:glycogen synthase
VLFPVRWEEPWGLVPLEAMAAGRPVVATATGGAAEYLRDGENALVVPPDDPVALAAAVRRLEDEGLRARLVAGGRATAARYPRAAFDAALVAAVESSAASRV